MGKFGFRDLREGEGCSSLAVAMVANWESISEFRTCIGGRITPVEF